MRRKSLIVIVMLLMSFNMSAQKKNKKNTRMIYKNDEIEISFPGSFREVEKDQFMAATNKTYESGYFYELEKKIRFHEDDQEKFYTAEDGTMIPTQHIMSSSGYLSILYIFPVVEKSVLLLEIEKAFKPEKSVVKYREVSETKINELNLLNWRTQQGKNRFEYYLLLGGRHNYLFISTAYGEKDYIENILRNTKFLK